MSVVMRCVGELPPSRRASYCVFTPLFHSLPHQVRPILVTPSPDTSPTASQGMCKLWSVQKMSRSPSLRASWLTQCYRLRLNGMMVYIMVHWVDLPGLKTFQFALQRALASDNGVYYRSGYGLIFSTTGLLSRRQQTCGC